MSEKAIAVPCLAENKAFFNDYFNKRAVIAVKPEKRTTKSNAKILPGLFTIPVLYQHSLEALSLTHTQ